MALNEPYFYSKIVSMYLKCITFNKSKRNDRLILIIVNDENVHISFCLSVKL